MKSEKNSAQAWIICITASLFFLYNFIQATVMDSLSVYLMHDFKLNALQLANLSAGFFYGNLVALIPAGIILDRLSTKKIVCVALGIYILSTLLFCFSNSFYAAFLSRFISGICGGFAFLSCMRFASRWFTADKLPLIIGIMITIAFCGGIISHEPMIAISNILGWRGAFIVLTIFGMLVLSASHFILVDEPNNITQENTNEFKFSFSILYEQLKQLSLNPFIWIGSLYTTFLNLPVILFGALWSTIYLQQAHNLSIDQASIIASLTFVGLIIGTPLVGYYAKSEAKIYNVLMAGSLLSCLFLYMLIFYSGNSFVWLSIIFFCLGLFSSTQSVGYPIVITNTKPELTSLASSIISIFVLGGGTLIKIIFGMILDHSWSGSVAKSGIRLYSISGFNFAIVFVSLFFMASLILAVTYKAKTMRKIDIVELTN